jgi:hypothetical protein
MKGSALSASSRINLARCFKNSSSIIKIPPPNKELHPLRSPKFIQQETPAVCPVSDATGFRTHELRYGGAVLVRNPLRICIAVGMVGRAAGELRSSLICENALTQHKPSSDRSDCVHALAASLPESKSQLAFWEVVAMIRQENGNWVAYCDRDCGASVNTGLRSLQQAVNYLSRAERWDSRKYRDLWFNYCPRCGEYGPTRD